MNTEKYDRIAEECRHNAEAAVNRDVKERWLKLYEGWEALARSTTAAELPKAKGQLGSQSMKEKDK